MQVILKQIRHRALRNLCIICCFNIDHRSRASLMNGIRSCQWQITFRKLFYQMNRKEVDYRRLSLYDSSITWKIPQRWSDGVIAASGPILRDTVRWKQRQDRDINGVLKWAIINVYWPSHHSKSSPLACLRYLSQASTPRWVFSTSVPSSSLRGLGNPKLGLGIINHVGVDLRITSLNTSIRPSEVYICKHADTDI